MRWLRSRGSWPVLVMALAVILGLSASAHAGWDGHQEITLGDRVSAAFAEDPGTEMHRLEFYAPAGTVFSAKFKVASGDATLDVWVEDSYWGEVDLGGAQSGSDVRNFTFEQSGWYTLVVAAASGTGRYDVATKGKFPKKFKGDSSDEEMEFGALAGTTFSAKAKPAKGSGAKPVLDVLEGPDGMDIDIDAGAVLKNVRLLMTGRHLLGWSNDGADGDVALMLKWKAPKSKASWIFGPVKLPEGSPEDIRADWLGSPHADRSAEAFHHWDEDGTISTSCARCHSTPGFRDYIGADGTAAGVVDNPAPIGTVIDCNACHNESALDLSTVTFPSGLTLSGLGAEARCMQCHQGRESGIDVDDSIESAGVDDDTTSSSLRFLNVHYLPAGATLYGKQAQGAYQFAGKIYNGKVTHVASHDTCIECHDQHSTKLRLDECYTCHKAADLDGVNDPGYQKLSYEELKGIRMKRTNFDYDGDGDTDEGVYGELQTLGDILLESMQAYATNVVGTSIAYDSHSYPYFFVDTNGNGVIDAGETGRYSSFTPRLLRAAYNYQYFNKDPGNYAHNSRYMFQVLYDTIEHLNEHEDVDVVDMETLVRNEADGHFDATAEAYRHWDDDGHVSSSCARCHSPEGFDFWAKYGIDTPLNTALSDGMKCETCHVGGDFGEALPALKYIDEITFPSGVTIQNDPSDPDHSFICMSCHRGRESAASIAEDIAEGDFRFENIHYLAAGSTLYGADAQVGWQYPAKSYSGKWNHFTQGESGNVSECTYCHLKDHTFRPQLREICLECHDDTPIDEVRLQRTTDYDGDDDNTEPLEDELATFGDRLLTAMQDWSESEHEVGIVYDAHAYPYWFKDTGGRYSNWDPELMKAAFNYQMYAKDPGAWAHNTHYILQLLYDSIQDLGGNTTGLTRPPADNE